MWTASQAHTEEVSALFDKDNAGRESPIAPRTTYGIDDFHTHNTSSFLHDGSIVKPASSYGKNMFTIGETTGQ